MEAMAAEELHTCADRKLYCIIRGELPFEATLLCSDIVMGDISCFRMLRSSDIHRFFPWRDDATTGGLSSQTA
jgi:hypothetical protein